MTSKYLQVPSSGYGQVDTRQQQQQGECVCGWVGDAVPLPLYLPTLSALHSNKMCSARYM